MYYTYTVIASRVYNILFILFFFSAADIRPERKELSSARRYIKRAARVDRFDHENV